jgi:hypothetical protein
MAVGTDTALDSLVESLVPAAPTLRYVCVCIIVSDAPVAPRWVTIRPHEGRYAGWEVRRALKDVRFHDWEDAWREPGCS